MNSSEKNDTEVCIIGAGVTGLYLSSLLAGAGIKTTTIEKKRELGKPACSGIVSEHFSEYLPIKPAFLERKLNTIFIHTGGETPLRIKKRTYVLNRVELDSHIFSEMSDKPLSKLKLNSPALSITTDKKKILVKTPHESIRASLLVDASGTGSASSNIISNRAKLYNAAVTRLPTVENRNEKHASHVYYDKTISKNYFAWRVPRKDTEEYGVISKNATQALIKFLNDQHINFDPRNLKIINHAIRFCDCDYKDISTVSDRLILLGECACQNKPLTGGGIVYGLICAKIAYEAIKKALNFNRTDKNFLKHEYEDKWKAVLREPISTQRDILEAISHINLSGMEFPQIRFDTDYDFLS